MATARHLSTTMVFEFVDNDGKATSRFKLPYMDKDITDVQFLTMAYSINGLMDSNHTAPNFYKIVEEEIY